MLRRLFPAPLLAAAAACGIDRYAESAPPASTALRDSAATVGATHEPAPRPLRDTAAEAAARVPASGYLVWSADSARGLGRRRRVERSDSAHAPALLARFRAAAP